MNRMDIVEKVKQALSNVFKYDIQTAYGVTGIHTVDVESICTVTFTFGDKKDSQKLKVILHNSDRELDHVMDEIVVTESLLDEQTDKIVSIVHNLVETYKARRKITLSNIIDAYGSSPVDQLIKTAKDAFTYNWKPGAEPNSLVVYNRFKIRVISNKSRIGYTIYDNGKVLDSGFSSVHFSKAWYETYLKALERIRFVKECYKELNNSVKQHRSNVKPHVDEGKLTHFHHKLHPLLEPIDVVKTLDTKRIAILEDIIERLTPKYILSGNVARKMILEYDIPRTLKTVVVVLRPEKVYEYYVQTPNNIDVPSIVMPFAAMELSAFLNAVALELAK